MTFGGFGPLFWREVTRLGRQPRFFGLRLGYAIVLFTLVLWLGADILWRADSRHERGESLDIAVSLYRTAAVVQLAWIVFVTPIVVCGAITEERRSGHWDLLLITPLADREILFEKLLGRLAASAYLLLGGLPVMSLIMLLGGIDPLGLAWMQWSSLTFMLLTACCALNHAVRITGAVPALVATLASLFFWLLAFPLAITYFVVWTAMPIVVLWELEPPPLAITAAVSPHPASSFLAAVFASQSLSLAETAIFLGGSTATALFGSWCWFAAASRRLRDHGERLGQWLDGVAQGAVNGGDARRHPLARFLEGFIDAISQGAIGLTMSLLITSFFALFLVTIAWPIVVLPVFWMLAALIAGFAGATNPVVRQMGLWEILRATPMTRWELLAAASRGNAKVLKWLIQGGIAMTFFGMAMPGETLTIALWGASAAWLSHVVGLGCVVIAKRPVEALAAWILAVALTVLVPLVAVNSPLPLDSLAVAVALATATIAFGWLTLRRPKPAWFAAACACCLLLLQAVVLRQLGPDPMRLMSPPAGALWTIAGRVAYSLPACVSAVLAIWFLHARFDRIVDRPCSHC